MIIRRTVPADLAAIYKLESAVFTGDAWSEKDLSAVITSSGAMCFSALGDDGELYGYTIGRIIAPEGEIYKVAVLPERQGKGIAYRLLSYALKTERGRGLETVFLEVRSQNLAAIKLYRSLCFKEIGRRKNYYKNPTDDAIIMMMGGGINI